MNNLSILFTQVKGVPCNTYEVITIHILHQNLYFNLVVAAFEFTTDPFLLKGLEKSSIVK